LHGIKSPIEGRANNVTITMDTYLINEHSFSITIVTSDLWLTETKQPFRLYILFKFKIILHSNNKKIGLSPIVIRLYNYPL
jgi:hypothetical protein